MLITRRLLKLFSITLACSYATSAFATNYGNGIHQHYVSPRALGMGNAFVAVANDYSAIFYNPAGLARREDGELNLSLDLAATPAAVKFSEDITAASKLPEADKNQAYADLLEAQYGKTYGMRVQAPSAILARPGWGFGIIPMDLSVDLDINNTIGPSVTPTVYADTTFALAYADDWKRIEDGRLSWGVTGKFVHRGFFSKPITLIELAVDSTLVDSSDFTEGYTIDADIGFMYTPIIPNEGFVQVFRLARPTFGVVFRNVAETGFGQNFKAFSRNPVGEPEKLYRTIDIGSKWEYPSFWIFSGRGVLDIKDINHPRFTMKRGLHAGFEFDWTVASWWRGQYRVGYSQGYISYGASALFGVFNLDAVSYGEEVGSISEARENRVYMARMSLNF
ncbi:MAG: hypothetical protein V4736_14090 [Bdellovibrionota bacterium]